MSSPRVRVAMLSFLAAALIGPALARAEGDAAKAPGKPAAAAATDMSAMAAPKPAAQNKLLQNLVGQWKATSKMWMDPSQPPLEFQGTEEIRSIGGGMWFETDSRANMGGMPFEGHGFEGWDAHKQKYVGSWVDSFSSALTSYEGTASPDGKTVTYTMVGPNMQGEMETSTMVVTVLDANHRMWRAYKGTDTSAHPTMEMSYVRVTEAQADSKAPATPH